MGAPFDHIAFQYDADFTQTAIGQMQRKQVWEYLEKITPELSGLEILELNCGTGEDAVLFSERGFNILATDVSAEMLKVTQLKAQQYSLQHRISSHYLDLDNVDELVFNKKFDLIFSNFGGLNCIRPESFERLLQKLPFLLLPKGRFIAVIMPRVCLWESFYFLLKFRFRQAFRRLSRGSVIADLQGTTVKTWYYSPGQIKKWAATHFKPAGLKPIGIALPPSYLENFFSGKRRMLSLLNGAEKRLNKLRFLSRFADHYIIDLQLK